MWPWFGIGISFWDVFLPENILCRAYRFEPTGIWSDTRVSSVILGHGCCQSVEISLTLMNNAASLNTGECKTWERWIYLLPLQSTLLYFRYFVGNIFRFTCYRKLNAYLLCIWNFVILNVQVVFWMLRTQTARLVRYGKKCQDHRFCHWMR